MRQNPAQIRHFGWSKNIGISNKNFFQSSEINSANERYNIVERFYETTQLEK